MRWLYCKIALILVVLSGNIFSQSNNVLLDSMQLEEAYSYLDLEEAVKHPEMVIRLELRKKKLKEFPKEIFMFKNLQYLDLSRNQLTELPDSIYKLTQLQYLDVSRNKLSSFPKEIGKVSNLVYLHANNNDLLGLPPQIGNLERLRIIDLWSNDLSDFPESLGRLKELTVLDIRAIMINVDTIRQLKKWMPNVDIKYDPPCNCKL